MQSALPSVEWSSQWLRLQENAATGLTLLSNRIKGSPYRMLSFIWPTERSVASDDMKTAAMSLEFYSGGQGGVVTLVLRSLPEHGVKISVFSLLETWSSDQIAIGHPTAPAIKAAMAKVDELIQRIIAGETGRVLLAG